MKAQRAFTLIELLIVVAIIAILAAIALPNFQEAQVRAKVSRVKADMRTLSTALEAYCLDMGQYPQSVDNGWARWVYQLSTPVAYINPALYYEPFENHRGPASQHKHWYYYYGFNEMQVLNTHTEGDLYLTSDVHGGSRRIEWWMLMSVGPDQERNNNGAGTVVAWNNLIAPAIFCTFIYDPTNGSTSAGDILRAGGSIAGLSARGVRGVKLN